MCVAGRAGQYDAVVNRQYDKDNCHQQETKHPGKRNGVHAQRIVLPAFPMSGQHHQNALSANHGNAVEGVAHPDKCLLLLAFQAVHVKSVSGNIVRSRRKSHQPEKDHAALQPFRSGQSQGDTGQGYSDKPLHTDNPPTFAFKNIHKRTPQKFERPRQIQPTGVEGNLCVVQAQIFVHDHRNGHYCHIGQTFGKIQTGNPFPG